MLHFHWCFPFSNSINIQSQIWPDRFVVKCLFCELHYGFSPIIHDKLCIKVTSLLCIMLDTPVCVIPNLHIFPTHVLQGSFVVQHLAQTHSNVWCYLHWQHARKGSLNDQMTKKYFICPPAYCFNTSFKPLLNSFWKLIYLGLFSGLFFEPFHSVSCFCSCEQLLGFFCAMHL